MRTFFVAALATYTLAVKQFELGQVSAEGYNENGDYVSNLYDIDVQPLNFTDVTGEERTIDPNTETDWIGNVYYPIIEAHGTAIGHQVYGEVAASRDELMDTCEEGTKCREKVNKWVETEVTDVWTNVVEVLKTKIEHIEEETREIVEEGWDKWVQCEEDLPCCTWAEESQTNIKKKITSGRDVHYKNYLEWRRLEDRRIEIIDECPENAYPTCQDNGPCWDGSDRANDEDCSCPIYEHPSCPMLPDCQGGELRNQETCECPDQRAMAP